MGRAKSYAERLFDFPEIGALSRDAARTAVIKPANDRGVGVDDDGFEHLLQQTQGYPCFLQEWGKHAWDAAPKSPITLEDVRAATKTAIAALDEIGEGFPPLSEAPFTPGKIMTVFAKAPEGILRPPR